MNWDIIFTVVVVGTVLFMKQFGQDLIEKTNWHKNKKKKGEKLYKWATTPPYFTFRKIIYWIFVSTLLIVTLYLGLKLEMMM